MKDGLPSNSVNCLMEDSNGMLWIGTSAGPVYRDSRGFQYPTEMAASLQEQVLGMAEDAFGWIWMATSSHVLRVSRDKLILGKVAEGDIREFGLADGLRGVEGVRRQQSVVTDSMGRIWFSLNRGISSVDPARLARTGVPAIVHLQKISADNNTIGMAAPVRIPGGSKRITFDFTGLSLASPERVRFRYRLDGFDHRWSEPSATREAMYTTLPPGPYRFRVIASNPDGVWSSDEAAVGVEVNPLFWQTWWFRATAVLGCAFTTAAIYRMRLHQLTRSLNMRFDERLAERTRIAQELHDTLLQGFLSASMQVHVAADRLPADSQAKPILTRALQLMGQVIDEASRSISNRRFRASRRRLCPSNWRANESTFALL
jgi:signal transduction histidine kinase